MQKFVKSLHKRFSDTRRPEMLPDRKSFIIISLLSRSSNMSSDSALGDNSSLGCGHER